jgi:hypothetical protein
MADGSEQTKSSICALKQKWRCHDPERMEKINVDEAFDHSQREGSWGYDLCGEEGV